MESLIKTVVRSTNANASKSVGKIKCKKIIIIKVAEMRLTKVDVWCMTRLDGIKNECISGSLRVTNIASKMKGNRLRWFQTC